MEVASGWNDRHTSCLSHYRRRLKRELGFIAFLSNTTREYTK